jgi:hypothetical protein
VRQAALGRLSEEELLLLVSIWEAEEEQSPAPPWNEQQARAVEAYDTALAVELRAYNAALAAQSPRHRIRQNQFQEGG